MKITCRPKFIDPTQPAHEKGRIGVIDIGSSSVRIVVYDDVRGYPHLVLNQRVLCALGTGKTCGDTFSLCADRKQRALEAIEWFLWVAKEADCTTVVATATSAVREALNGADFIQDIKKQTGLHVEIISGEVEGRLAAAGALASVPQANGVVIDLGSGSCELCESHGEKNIVSYPMGALALQAQCATAQKALELARTNFAKTKWLKKLKDKDIVALGSGMRSLARLHIKHTRYPLNILHDYKITKDDALAFCQKIISGELKPDVPGMSAEWKKVLPYRAAVLCALIETTQAKIVRFATFGLREGLLFTQTENCTVVNDPLLAFTKDLAQREGRGLEYAEHLAAWVKPHLPMLDSRLISAAAHLCEIGWREQSVYRAKSVFDQILGAGFVAVNHHDRALLAVAAYSRHEEKLTQYVSRKVKFLLGEQNIYNAQLAGALFRLAVVLDPGFKGHLAQYTLKRDKQKFVIEAAKSQLALNSEAVQKRLKNVNKALAQTL